MGEVKRANLLRIAPVADERWKNTHNPGVDYDCVVVS
jgi:hypothetical protein